MRSYLLLLLVPGALFAQTPTASVVGRVSDPTGALLPGALIRITNLSTNQISSGVANNEGDYTVPYLNPGRYTMEASAAGFRDYKHAEFALEVGQSLRLDLKMELGSASESITVSDTPPALNTESGSRGDVTSNAELTEIPLSGRNFSDLVFLTGGVAPKGEDGDGAYAINGARADNVGFLVDGMNNTQRRNTGAIVSPPLEGVQEFKIITSGFSAEYGRYAGGVLSVVTKSGGNRVRGSLYEFIRNDVLDARNFFAVDKARLRQNQFGATLSGPVRLPKLYNGRDKTFFLVSWESLRAVSGTTQRGIVPSPQMLQGDFSQVTDAFGKPLKVLDPLAKSAPFAGNQLPLSRLDPVSLKLAAYYPGPNLAGSANNYLAQANSTNDFNNFSIKVDHSIGSKDRLTFSTFWKPNNSFAPFQRSPIAAFGSTSASFGTLAGIRHIHTFTPTLFNEASASFSRLMLNQGWPSNTRDWSAEVGYAGATRNPAALGLPYIDVSGYIVLGHAYDLPKIWSYNNYQYSDSMTWIHGLHTVKLGGEFLRYQYFNKTYGDLRGRMTFLGRFTNQPMADFLLGYAQTSRRLMDVSRAYQLASNHAAYITDDFKVTPTLTLNLGVRYELLKPPAEKYDARSAFVQSLGKVVIAGNGGLANLPDLIQQTGLAQYVVMAQDAGLPRSITRANYLDFAPRFGFAWRPFGNAKTVIRGGYGIFFGTDSLYRYDELSNTYPFSITQSFTATSTNPLLLTVSNPFPPAKAKVAGINSTSGENPDNRDQYLQSWNMTIEREFAGGTVIELSYAASKGTHLPRRYDINQQTLNPAVRNPDGTFPRPFPAFSSINYFANVANSNYNSGSASLRRRLSKSFFVRAAYTFAKSIDEASNTGGVIAAGFPSAQDSRNLRGERGRSDFDVRHSFLASAIWAPRFTKNVFLRDWQIAGTTRAYTGPPFTPKVANYDVTLGGAARPDRIATGSLANPSPDAWFDRTAFPPVPVGAYHFGNSGRNILDGPGTFNIDSALSRRFRFTETLAFQMRIEAFNVLNHTNFNLPQTQVDVLNGATISQAKSARLFQLGARLEF